MLSEPFQVPFENDPLWSVVILTLWSRIRKAGICSQYFMSQIQAESRILLYWFFMYIGRSHCGNGGNIILGLQNLQRKKTLMAHSRHRISVSTFPITCPFAGKDFPPPCPGDLIFKCIRGIWIKIRHLHKKLRSWTFISRV